MSTRSNICLILNKEDIGKVVKFDETKLPKDVTCDNEFLNLVEEVTLEKTSFRDISSLGWLSGKSWENTFGAIQ